MKKYLTMVIIFLLLSSFAYCKEAPESNGPWFAFNYSIGWGMGAPGTGKPAGVEFSVWIDDGTGFVCKYKADWTLLKWYPDAINLSEYEGKQIKIRLQTKHIENRIHQDYPYFGNPSICVGPLTNLTVVKNLALIKPDDFGGIKDDGTYVKMEDEDPVFHDATVLSATNQAEKIAIFSGEKYITVPGRAMSGLFMGINMGTEYLSVGAGPLNEAYIGEMPPAVYAQWVVDVPIASESVNDKAGKQSSLSYTAPADYTGDLLFTPRKDLIILSTESDVYKYSDGLSAKFVDNTFNLKTREGVGYAFAGCEILNLDKINLKINNLPTNLKSIDDNSFFGFVLDYHTNMGYINRVWLGLGAMSEGRFDKRVACWIYDDASMSLIQRYTFNEKFFDIKDKIVDDKLTLNFKDYAPGDWDGKVWVGVGSQNIDAPIDFQASIVDINTYVPNKPIATINEIDGKFIKVVKDDITYAISKTNGAICGLWHGEEKVFDEAADIYTIERLTTISKSAEIYDKVKKINNKNGKVYVECENIIAPELKIIKEYFLTDNGELTKKTTFETQDKDGFFIRLDANASINQEFKKGANGFGALISRKVVAQGKVMEADEAPAEQAGNGVAPVMIKKDFSFGFGGFRYKVNDKYVMRSTTKRIPTGFNTKIFTDFLKPEAPVSGEMVYKFFQGNLMAFDKYYHDLPEYKALFDINSPEWVKRVVSDAMYLNNGMEPFHKMADPLIVTQTIWMFNSPWGNWGGYHANPDGRFPGTHQVAPGHRSHNPNARLAKYNNFCFDATSDLYRDHIDWAVMDREGEPVSTGINSDSSHGPSFYPQILRPEMRKLLLDMHADQIRQWKLDYYYTDGPGYGQEEIDWSIMDVTQNYDWLEYVRDLYLTVRNVNPEAVIFANGLMPYSSFSYIEFREPQWQQQMTEDWRQIGLELFGSKFEQPECNTVVPTYGHLAADPALSSYTIMYGWAGNLFNVERYPFMEAAWEYRDIKLLENALSPNWLNEDTYFEANAFTKGNETIVNIFNHDPNKDTVKLTLDVSKTNLKVGELVNSYYLLMNDTAKTMKNENGEDVVDPSTIVEKGFKDPVIIKWGEVCPEKIEFEVPCRHGLITSVVFTHCPALISKVDKKETHTYLPTQLDVKAYGTTKEGLSEFGVDADADCEIIVPGYGLFDDFTTSYQYTQVVWAGMPSLKIILPRGKHLFKFNKGETLQETIICDLNFDDGNIGISDIHKPEGVEYNVVDSETGKALNVIGNNVWTYARQGYSVPNQAKGSKYLNIAFDFKVLDDKNGVVPAIQFDLAGKANETLAFTYKDGALYFRDIMVSKYDDKFNHVEAVIDNVTGQICVKYNSQMWGRYFSDDIVKPVIEKKEGDFLTWDQVKPFITSPNGGGKGSILYDNIVIKSVSE